MMETRLTIDWTAREFRVKEVDQNEPRFRWALRFNRQNKVTGDGRMAFMLGADQQVDVAFSVVDSRGNPATIDGAATWLSSDAAVLTVTPASPNSATVLAVGPVGTAQVQVTVDADLGEGTRELLGILDVEVVGGEGVALTLTPGTPTPQPAT